MAFALVLAGGLAAVEPAHALRRKSDCTGGAVAGAVAGGLAGGALASGSKNQGLAILSGVTLGGLVGHAICEELDKNDRDHAFNRSLREIRIRREIRRREVFGPAPEVPRGFRSVHTEVVSSGYYPGTQRECYKTFTEFETENNTALKTYTFICQDYDASPNYVEVQETYTRNITWYNGFDGITRVQTTTRTRTYTEAPVMVAPVPVEIPQPISTVRPVSFMNAENFALALKALNELGVSAMMRRGEPNPAYASDMARFNYVVNELIPWLQNGNSHLLVLSTGQLQEILSGFSQNGGFQGPISTNLQPYVR